jgi:hypothetical protein
MKLDAATSFVAARTLDTIVNRVNRLIAMPAIERRCCCRSLTAATSG